MPTLPDDQAVHAGSIKILPPLRRSRPGAAARRRGIAGLDPPLEWIEAVRHSANSQESSHYELRTFRVRVIAGARSAPAKARFALGAGRSGDAAVASAIRARAGALAVDRPQWMLRSCRP
jgi:hypothetical protein